MSSVRTPGVQARSHPGISNFENYLEMAKALNVDADYRAKIGDLGAVDFYQVTLQ